MLHVLRKCLVIRECTNKKKLFVLVANMKCQCTAMAHRADPQAHRGGGGTMTILRGGRGGPSSRAPYIYEAFAASWVLSAQLFLEALACKSYFWGSRLRPWRGKCL